MAKYVLTSKLIEVVKDGQKKKFPKFFVRLPKKDGTLKPFKAQLSDNAKAQLTLSNIPTPCEIEVNASFVKEESYENKKGQTITQKVVVITDLKVLGKYEFENTTIDDLANEIVSED